MGLRPKPRLEPSFGEGSKNSKNFTAKGTREVVRIDAYCVSGALCGEALEFLGLFRREVLSGIWGGASKSSPSLRSVRLPGWGEISIVERYYIKPRTTERAFPFEGEGGAKRRMRAGGWC